MLSNTFCSFLAWLRFPQNQDINLIQTSIRGGGSNSSNISHTFAWGVAAVVFHSQIAGSPFSDPFLDVSLL